VDHRPNVNLLKELIYLLGHSENQSDVKGSVIQLGLHDVEEDPPYREYVGSKNFGVDVLFENGAMKAVHIFTKDMQGFLACTWALPFGLAPGMSQEEVHRVLGEPSSFDAFDSEYVQMPPGVRLKINYDKALRMTCLNIGKSG
jgi:hypothetical protein